MRRVVALLLASTVLLAIAVPPAAAVQAPARPTVLFTTLTGAAERPGPGDPDASGFAFFIVNPLQGEICAIVFIRNIVLPATGAHIHLAPPTAPGPIVVPFQAPTRTVSRSCVPVETVLLNNIAANPGQYYYNVHDQNFPAGAARGQLMPIIAIGMGGLGGLVTLGALGSR